MSRDVEIISVGNELLIGKTLNTNAHWLSRRITSLGLSVSRITIIGDDVRKIGRALREAVNRNPLFIIATGGLGPTFDDKTAEGLAEALGSNLHVDEEALKMIREKYDEYAREMDHEKFELTPARAKMATIPEGSKPLPNPVGTAPAITVKCKQTTVFALPGVPIEMEKLFESSVSPLLKASVSNLTFFETSLLVSGIMESEIAPALEHVMHDNPYIYIKSHPKGAEKEPSLELHLSTTASKAEVAKKRVSKALIQLTEIARSKGGTTRIARRRK